MKCAGCRVQGAGGTIVGVTGSGDRHFPGPCLIRTDNIQGPLMKPTGVGAPVCLALTKGSIPRADEIGEIRPPIKKNLSLGLGTI